MAETVRELLQQKGIDIPPPEVIQNTLRKVFNFAAEPLFSIQDGRLKVAEEVTPAVLMGAIFGKGKVVDAKKLFAKKIAAAPAFKPGLAKDNQGDFIAKGFHGSPQHVESPKITQLKHGDTFEGTSTTGVSRGIFTTNNPDLSRMFAHGVMGGDIKNFMFRTETNLGRKPLVVDVKGTRFNPRLEEKLLRKADGEGFTGLIMKNVEKEGTDIYVALNPERVKILKTFDLTVGDIFKKE